MIVKGQDFLILWKEYIQSFDKDIDLLELTYSFFKRVVKSSPKPYRKSSNSKVRSKWFSKLLDDNFVKNVHYENGELKIIVGTRNVTTLIAKRVDDYHWELVKTCNCLADVKSFWCIHKGALMLMISMIKKYNINYIDYNILDKVISETHQAKSENDVNNNLWVKVRKAIDEVLSKYFP